jgi:hypothetical protein
LPGEETISALDRFLIVRLEARQMSYRDAATSGTNIAASYGRAAECKERAPSATHPETKAEYIRLARGWVHLARSYEFVESLERFLLDATRKRHSLRPRTFQKFPTLYADENRREQKTRSPEKSGLLY